MKVKVIIGRALVVIAWALLLGTVGSVEFNGMALTEGVIQVGISLAVLGIGLFMMKIGGKKNGRI